MLLNSNMNIKHFEVIFIFLCYQKIRLSFLWKYEDLHEMSSPGFGKETFYINGQVLFSGGIRGIIALDKVIFFFSCKILIFFLFHHETARYPQHTFFLRNNKNIYLHTPLFWS